MRQSIARTAAIAYAGIAYAAFVVVALWAIGFLADAGTPTVVDGVARRPAWLALTVDAGLLLIFAVQHSVMARTQVKRRLARIVPLAVGRSTYVLATSLVLGLLFWQWQPVPTAVWRVGASPWDGLVWSVYALGWLTTVSATFMVDHLDFLGIRQARWRGPGRYEPPPFRERWLYAWVRHPMMLGLLIAFWATPRMTVGHLFFAAAGTGYVAVGLRFEERDLYRQLGDTYRDYADRVPALVPSPTRRIGERRSVTDE
jgi:protein-S-isoprenylcysteine O-methyltransferase Ste14